MRKKLVWLVVSCLMVAALLLASCAPAVTEEEEEVVTPGEEEEVVTPEEEEEAVAAPEEPKYGGVYRGRGGDPQGFDDAYAPPWMCFTLNLTNEEMTTGDWTKGPAGTGESGWTGEIDTYFQHLQTASLAESWELPDAQTVIYHIRKGVHFHDKPPVNGREMTAEDVVYSIKRYTETPGSYGNTSTKPEERATVTAPDKWTVVLKYPPAAIGQHYMRFSDFCRVVPQEMVEEWGDLQDWRAACGTGPFILADYVNMSSLTFERNPNYWRKDPLHPENTLPYVDSLKLLIIEDTSTSIAAMRTGKLDHLGVGWEDAESLMETNPELKYTRHLQGFSWNIFMRVDQPELPFYDVRVRRALAMAVDNRAIAEDYYGGNAHILTSPIMPAPEFDCMYTPLEEQNEIVQELFGYHPEKAKQLLAEAGYPDGFKATILCAGTGDLLSIYKEYWAAIGVELEIEIKDWPVLASIAARRSHKEMILYYAGNSTPLAPASLAPHLWENLSMIDDQRVNEAFEKVAENEANWDVVCSTLKETYPYVLEQCWMIEAPTNYDYNFWHPWLKNYHGEYSVGFFNGPNFLMYIWLDQDLREEMTGKR